MTLATEQTTRQGYPGVMLGEGTVVDPTAHVGIPARGSTPGAVPTRLGDGCQVRAMTAIYAGAILGDRVQTGHGTLIREDNVVGDDSSVGTNAVLEPGNRIGARTRIHSGCFLELVTLEDDVFVGPNVTFTDDPHPPCPHYERCVGGATVRSGASIGANATILPGVVIGRDALVGAGAVVVRDVPDRAVVVGNPARQICTVDDLECTSALTERPYDWRATP